MAQEGGTRGIAIVNTRDGVSVNFDIFVDLEDMGMLICQGLLSLITNIVKGDRVNLFPRIFGMQRHGLPCVGGNGPYDPP